MRVWMEEGCESKRVRTGRSASGAKGLGFKEWLGVKVGEERDLLREGRGGGSGEFRSRDGEWLIKG